MGAQAPYIKLWSKVESRREGQKMTVRQPAVAGMFYAAGPEALQQDVDRLLSGAGNHTGCVPKAMIVPHAGYVYSGPVAAEAYGLLRPARDRIRRVVLFGPSHRVYLDGMGIPSVDKFATPLGEVPLDRQTLAMVAPLPGVRVSDAAHKDEHSLEVQLPFLQTVLSDFELAPIVVGDCNADLVADVMDAVWGGPETLVLVSSDLSHYLSYGDAKEVDENTCRRILNKETTLSGHEACGAYAVNGLMRSRHSVPLTVQTLDLRNSGDTAGTKDRVVGYGAFVLH